MTFNVFSNALYSEYSCSRNSPLNCDRLQQTLQEYKGAKFCIDCGFPVTLAAGQKLEGRLGCYQVKKYLGARGCGRLYAGMQLGNQPVVIKEYLLPENCFNDAEAQQRKAAFTQVAGLAPVDGRIQDFRCIPVIEAIADVRDRRCYLITEDMPSITLKYYLTEHGAMSAAQVRNVLHQVLQTLQFLHSQKLRRPSGQIDRGVIHGNLNLESLLLAGSPHRFRIYLCDLADWEALFQAAVIQTTKPQISDDLMALGQVAFHLWNGKITDASGQPLDPRAPQFWSSEDPHLKQVILQLMGIEQPFESAEAARLALGQSASSEPLPQPSSTTITASDEPKFKRWLWLGILTLLAGIGLLFLRSFLHSQFIAQTSFASYHQLPFKKLTDISGIDPGTFSYVSEQDGTWSFVLKQPMRNRTLGDILHRPKPDVEAQFNLQGLQSTVNPHEMPNPNVLLSHVQQGKADFAITSLADQLPDDLEKVQFAYDGLFVFVPFNKGETLSKALNGQISLENLRRIYSGEITNWQELGGPDLKITPQMPTEPEAVQLFQKLVLQDASAIAQFQKTVSVPQSTRITQEQGRSEFAAGRSGIISFGIFSKTWNQCSGYPLALKTNSKTVQALQRSNGKPITPNVNLCDKANFLNASLFLSKQYPLGYSLFVVYPKDNRQSAGRKFAELLQSQEGQCLLSQVGLVPLQPVPNGCSDIP